ncbi:hypothetical protein PMAYCL1PPCAC_32744 [Pristionchus mayeri]|uniref:SET domain-containing protein n=1 Tax=Pristionchus mayeri TaxID=1317129 RepID=A0AAN5IFM7_9BILA|nr:hypothetical protein PMAYCL1PPCAC_32744 [Pristionchus mayeri]
MGEELFRKVYPNRYLEFEEGQGDGGYVVNKLALYKNRLRAIEWRWNYICARAGLPPLFIEDWTNEQEDDEALWKLEFIVKLLKSAPVKNILKEFNQIKDLKCHEVCGECAKDKRDKKDKKEVTRCCNMNCSIYILDEKGTAEMKDDGDGKRAFGYDNIHFECTAECGCGVRCMNRRLQKGRQIKLVIFREPKKGWGIRCVSEIKKGDFVTEYAGEVTMTGRRNHYDYEMTKYKAVADNGKTYRTPLNIAAGTRGNEARFFAHSCAPNLDPKITIVERHAMFFHHISFIALRTIFPGEELTFSYFDDGEKAKESIKSMFGYCSCRSNKCQRPAPIHSNAVKSEEEDEMSGDDYADIEDDEKPGPSTRGRSTSIRDEDKKKKRGGRRSMGVKNEEKEREKGVMQLKKSIGATRKRHHEGRVKREEGEERRKEEEEGRMKDEG